MRIRWIVLLIIFTGCIDRGAESYKKHFKQYQDEYMTLYRTLKPLLENDSLFKFTVEFTGKRFIEYSYINDSTIYSFYTVGLEEEDKSKLSHVMYKLGLKYTTIYRDSIQYVFSGYNKDIITIYRSDLPSRHGIELDRNVYLRFIEWE